MIDLSKLTYFCLQGFLLGAGPCLLVCAPILLPYIAGTQKSWRAGWRAALYFGLARLAVYILLGGVVGYIGTYLFQIFYSAWWGKYLWTLAGILIILVGILLVIGRRSANPLCRYLQKQTLDESAKSLIILGLIVGFTPCLPLIAVLTEIMFISERFYQGFVYGLAFGVGTVFSPLLFLGALAPLLRGKFVPETLFNRLCGLLLVLFGIYLIFSRS